MATNNLTLPIPDGYDCTELRFTLKRAKIPVNITPKVQVQQEEPESGVCDFCRKPCKGDVCAGCYMKMQNHFLGKGCKCEL